MSKLILVLACGVGILGAQEKKTAAAEPKKAEKQAETAGQGGLRVFKDPVTGELREPTAAERQALQPAGALPGGNTPVRVIRNADGSDTAILGPAQMVYSVMRKNPDGTVTMECVTGEKKAESFLKLPKTPVDLSNKSTATERTNDK